MRFLKNQFLILLLSICMMSSGVYAAWVYMQSPDPQFQSIAVAIQGFTYGPFYITKVETVGGNYSSATAKKTGETDIESNITLNNQESSSVVLHVTFYNSTDVSYYYKDTETVSSNNEKIGYTVSDIEQKEEVSARTFKTITVTYHYKNGVANNKSLLSKLHFNFVIDKDSIGIVAAQTAVTRFEAILNNEVAQNSYQILEDGMNARGSNASSVSYIGNVAGAKDDDSLLIEQLFTQEFLTMDLDGDGVSEPITLMIKRENLDGDESTGDDYTYDSLFGIDRTVKGVEFTLYITSEGFDSSKLNVYAATYTKLPGSDKWVQVVPLTKGTATANRYTIGFGKNNSFNTDTWKSTDGQTMDTLTKNAIKNLT